MPITKAAKKALRQSSKKRIRNLREKRSLKALLKKVALLISEKNKEEAKKSLPQAYKALDKAAKMRIISKNRASRQKSRIAKSLAKLS